MIEIKNPAYLLFCDYQDAEPRARIRKAHGWWVADCHACRTAWILRTHPDAVDTLIEHIRQMRCRSWVVHVEFLHRDPETP